MTECCPRRQGWFVNEDTGEIECCDDCARYLTDEDALVAAATRGNTHAKVALAIESALNDAQDLVADAHTREQLRRALVRAVYERK